MKIRAFNLVPGAVITWTGRDKPYIIHEVARDQVKEDVSVVNVEGLNWQTFDYNDEVTLVGLTPNHDNLDEDDFGTKVPLVEERRLVDAFLAAHLAAVEWRNRETGEVDTTDVLKAYNALPEATRTVARNGIKAAMEAGLVQSNLSLARANLLIHQSLATNKVHRHKK